MYTSAMSEFAKMDIFFLVTTLVVIALAILVALILYRVWQILGHVENISRNVAEESTMLRSDIARLRTSVMEEGFKWKHMSTFFRSMIGRYTTKKSASKKD
jgi:hypothetical protein